MGFLFIAIGATCGAWLRYGLGVILNPIFPTLALGTLCANLLGCFLIGIVMGSGLFSDSLRLAIVTGFLGSLTTFSTFSYEAITYLLREEIFWLFALVLVHVLGSIAMAYIGYLTVKFFQAV